MRNWQCNMSKNSVDKIPWSKFIDLIYIFMAKFNRRVPMDMITTMFQQLDSLGFKRKEDNCCHLSIQRIWSNKSPNLIKTHANPIHEEFPHLWTDLFIHSLSKKCTELSASRDYGEPSEGYHVIENTSSALKLLPMNAGNNVVSTVIVMLVLWQPEERTT